MSHWSHSAGRFICGSAGEMSDKKKEEIKQTQMIEDFCRSQLDVLPVTFARILLLFLSFRLPQETESNHKFPFSRRRRNGIETAEWKRDSRHNRNTNVLTTTTSAEWQIFSLMQVTDRHRDPETKERREGMRIFRAAHKPVLLFLPCWHESCCCRCCLKTAKPFHSMMLDRFWNCSSEIKQITGEATLNWWILYSISKCGIQPSQMHALLFGCQSKMFPRNQSACL